jgi:hypothetical protein
MEIQNLYQTKLLIDTINTLSMIVIIGLVSHLIIRLILQVVIFGKPHQFRINTESVYSITKMFHEGLYALSVGCSVILLILIISSNAPDSRLLPFLSELLRSNHILTVVGLIILIFISLPFRVFYAGKNPLTRVIEMGVTVIPLLLIILGIIFGSMSYFDYLIN